MLWGSRQPVAYAVNGSEKKALLKRLSLAKHTSPMGLWPESRTVNGVKRVSGLWFLVSGWGLS